MVTQPFATVARERLAHDEVIQRAPSKNEPPKTLLKLSAPNWLLKRSPVNVPNKRCATVRLTVQPF